MFIYVVLTLKKIKEYYKIYAVYPRRRRGIS